MMISRHNHGTKSCLDCLVANGCHPSGHRKPDLVCSGWSKGCSRDCQPASRLRKAVINEVVANTVEMPMEKSLSESNYEGAISGRNEDSSKG